MAETVLFQTVASEWWERYMLRGNLEYAEESWRRLEREVMPKLADKPLKKITAPMVLTILRRIEKRGTLVVARKVKSHISQIMRYGIACGLVNSDPARDLGWAMTPHKSKPRAAVTEPKQIGQLMRDIEHYRAKKRRCSLKLAALTVVGPGELCQAEWSEIEWDASVWRIPSSKMKMKRPHSVPLSRQALDVLRELQLVTGKNRWLFLSATHLRLSRVYVECLPYGDLIDRYDGPQTFFYLDPPYWDCEEYYGPGIFSREDFTKLAAQLGSIKGTFILSLNDTSGVREVFSAFSIEAVQTKYTCSNGKNIAAGEVLIRNW